MSVTYNTIFCRKIGSFTCKVVYFRIFLDKRQARLVKATAFLNLKNTTRKYLCIHMYNTHTWLSYSVYQQTNDVETSASHKSSKIKIVEKSLVLFYATFLRVVQDKSIYLTDDEVVSRAACCYY